MGWQTQSGLAPAQVGASGGREWTDGDTLRASDLNPAIADAVAATAPLFNAGVISIGSGGVTASGLVVTVPLGTAVYAGQVWTLAGTAATINVPDNATTYVWLCRDGVMRTSSASTPPSPFDAASAALLAVAIADTGTATIASDSAIGAHYAGLSRQVFDGWYYDNLPASQTHSQMSRSSAFGPYVVPMRAGYLTAVRAAINDTPTEGTATFEVYKNGTGTGLTCVLSDAGMDAVTVVAPGVVPVAASDRLDVRVTTSGDWTVPSTPNVIAAIEVTS